MKSKAATALFSSVKTSKVSEKVFQQLVSLIGSGQIKPGDQLPAERDLATELGVSRQSVREAFYKAEVHGLIKVRQGEGSFVLSSVGESLKTPLTLLLEEESETIFDFLEIRKLIEGWCAQQAAGEATPDDLAEMESILSRMNREGATDSVREKLDVAFHLAVAAASHNVIAVHIMEALKDNFDIFFEFRRQIKESSGTELLWRQHFDVYKAIADRSPEQARDKILEHLAYIEKGIRENLVKLQS